MHLRLTFWLALVFTAVAGMIRAQTPGAVDGYRDGQIVAKDVHGVVIAELNGVKTPLHDNDSVSPHSTVVTGAGAKVILVFSNGASTQLGGDTTLEIQQFLQKPFSADLDLAKITEEPTASKTKLKLTKGELLGKVAHLKRSEGSEYTVETPVGAAGIRGTTFHIVFIPEGNGQAFRFTLATVEGNVALTSGSSAPSSTPGTPAPSTTETPVPRGEQVTVTVNVTVDPVTNAVTVTSPSTVSSTVTVPIPAATLATLTSQAETIATTAASTTFTSSTNSNSGTGGSSTGDTSGDKKKDGDSSTGTSSDSSSSGGTSTGGSSTGESSTGGTSTGGTSTGGASTSTVSTPAPSTAPKPPTPPVTTPTSTLTPGAGK